MAEVICVAVVSNPSGAQRLQEAMERTSEELILNPDSENLQQIRRCLSLVWSSLTFRSSACDPDEERADMTMVFEEDADGCFGK